MPEFEYDVFLSHNSRDKPRVRRIAQRLKDAGLRVWFDEWVIQPGDDIYLAIERGLETARVQLLCLSAVALGSEWVALERSTVLFRDPTNAGRRFIPLLLEDCQLPDALRRYLYVDYRQECDAAAAALVAAIGGEALPQALGVDPVAAPKNTKPSWVWHCTDTSIAAGQISVLAVAEVFAAVGLYWWLSLHFEWPWFSMISLVAAPMLLLRSDASVKLGLRMLKPWAERDETDMGRSGKVTTILVAGLVVGLVAYLLSPVWLQGYIGLALFWRAGILGLFTALGTFSTVVMFAGAGTIAPADALTSAVVGVVVGLVAVAVAGTVAMAGVVVVPVVVTLVVAILVVVALVVAGMDVFAKIAQGLFFLFLTPALALAALLRALVIRLASTLSHPFLGLRQLPRNWCESLIVIDPFHLPELLPHAGKLHANFTVHGLWQRMSDATGAEKLIAAILIPALYLPALAYRWSLKASAWLWWPLALILTPPFQGLDGVAGRERAAHVASGAWAFPLLLPVAVLAWLALSDWPSVKDWLVLLPEVGQPAQTLLALLTPPPLGLRYILLWLAPLLALVLWWWRRNFYAAWSQVLASDKEYRDLSPEGRQRFDASARAVERLRLWLIVALVFLGEAIALIFAQGKDPQGVERMVWPWLLAWL